MSDELKACPWCDRLVEAYDFPAGHFIRCNWCGISTPYFGTEKEAIEAWNTRPLEDTLRLERDQAREMVARLIEAGNWLNAMHEDGVFVDELNAARTSRNFIRKRPNTEVTP